MHNIIAAAVHFSQVDIIRTQTLLLYNFPQQFMSNLTAGLLLFCPEQSVPGTAVRLNYPLLVLLI